MGRPHITQPPVPVDFIQQAFAVRQDGTLVRRECHVAALAHEPAAFALNGRLMVRVYVNGKIRRIAASRTAWALATGNWPKGVVRHRNGDDRDCRQENLLLTRHGRDPFGAISNKHSKGGRASSLAERWARTTTLIRTLADHPGATVPQISRLVGSSASCTCTGLGKLSDMGLTCGPKCDARARWDLTPAGKALAASAIPPLDNLDRDILMIIVRSPAKLMALAHRIEVCRLTSAEAHRQTRRTETHVPSRGTLRDHRRRDRRARPRRPAAPALGEFGARQSVNSEGRGGSPRSGA